ncbi:MAG: DNA double-strand break repair nuclease NurA, partial [Anaerolineae bacterium]|nr:DNA double-strand break repair nuclease NurA [Anaerolineae bacterium]
MTLELNKIAAQIEEMGRILAERGQRHKKVLPAAEALLHELAHDQEDLRRIAASEAGQRLRCAAPGDEPLDTALTAPEMPAEATLVAADGSQIYPDRHGPVFYYAINIGAIVFRHGSGQVPAVSTDPHLFYTEEKVYPGGDPVSSDLVNVERSVAEMRALTELILAESGRGCPCLGLADGSLLLWMERAALPSDRQAELFAAYLACLGRLRAEGSAVAGFVSRPHSAEVAALLYLGQLAPDQRGQVAGLSDTPYRGLTDRALFRRILEPGQRSALFARGTATNERYRAEGHRIWFFYLNTGADVARVELPEWLASRAQALSLVHAALYDQCRFNNGYPYVLTRADEQAV